MRHSRGMGIINESKMPRAKQKSRIDDTDFTEYAKGGPIWERPNPKKASKPLTPAKKAAAKRMAKAAGRPYPNLIDSMNAARKK